MIVFILAISIISLVTLAYLIGYFNGKEEGDRTGYKRCLKQFKYKGL